MFGFRPDPEDPTFVRKRRLAELAFDVSSFTFERTTTCNACGAEAFTQIARHDRYGLPIGSALCESCGLVFLDPRPTAESYDVFYRDWYRPLITAFTGALASPQERAAGRQRYAEQAIEKMLGHRLGDQHRQLLDLGASSGEVATYLRDRHGLEAMCVDPSPQETELARAAGLESTCATAEGYDPGDRRFDIILLCRTIDHLLDPARVLQRIHSWLTEDGLFFVDALDFEAVCMQVGYLSGALKIDHPFYLTRDTMDLLLTRAGFTPIARDISDRFHIRYLCRKALPTEAPPTETRPAPGSGTRAYRRIRRLQARGKPPSPRKIGPLHRAGRRVRRLFG